jgi:CRP-like cAMP-binding protein
LAHPLQVKTPKDMTLTDRPTQPPAITARQAAFWRSFRLFAGLSSEALAELAAAARPRDWAAGQVLFQRGDAGDDLIALAEGRVRLSLGTAQGRELVLRHAEAGDMLGELAVFDGAPRSADAVAVTATTGWVLDRAAMQSLARRHPDLMLSVAAYLCGRLRDTTDQMEGIALYSLEARLARFLLFTLRQIHGDDLPPDPRLRLDINQSELAAVLGASRPKVNRALQGLRDAGAVTRLDDVLACDVARLLTLAEPDAE